jgi:hypothetical protein
MDDGIEFADHLGGMCMIRRTVVFALGLALVVGLTIPTGPVFAMTTSMESLASSTASDSVSLLDRFGQWTTDLWLWMTGTAVLGANSGTEEPMPLPGEDSDSLTGQSAAMDPNGLD